ncbi:hypothetical protein GUK60_00530 [Campylobacter upsaliensis]|nr:hypothetical protein [Campylobacter upsaliensis]
MLKRVLGKANSRQNRAFCKAAEWALARLKGKIWGFCVSKRVGKPLGFGSFSGALPRDEKNIKKVN